MTQNWRTEVDALDYFSHQRKQLAVADRRPVIRKPSDLVGPGINANSTRITDFNDTLATYNGFFSAEDGAEHAPAAGEGFSGFVSSDSELGGFQLFVGLETEDVYRRVFTRNPMDAATIYWGAWAVITTGGGLIETLPASIIDAKGDLIVGSADNTPIRKAVGADGKVLMADAASTGGVKWGDLAPAKALLIDNLSAGGSVPGGTAVDTIIFQRAVVPASTTWDFKNLSALPSGWSRRGVASETFASDGMSATYAAGQGHFYTLPVGATDGTLECKFVTGPATTVMLGPQVWGSASAIGGGTSWYNSPSGCLALAVSSSHQYASAFTNAGGTPGTYPIWFRIRYASATAAVYASYSLDGVNWSAESPAQSRAIGTITDLSIGSMFGSGSMKVDYVKWIPGRINGGLLGWWDGSTIQSF